MEEDRDREDRSDFSRMNMRIPFRWRAGLLVLTVWSSLVQASEHWVNLGSNGRPVFTVQIDPNDSSTLYAIGTDPSGNPALYKTVDAGGFWAYLPAPFNGYSFPLVSLALEPSNPPVLFLGVTVYGVAGRLQGTFLYRSRDGGSTWEGLALASPRVLAFDRQSPGTVFAVVAPGVFSSRYGVLRSSDDGTTWAPLFTEDVLSIAISPENSLNLYVGTFGHGLWKSTDGGAHWSSANAGLTNPSAIATRVTNVVIDPNNPQTLYALTISFFESPPEVVSLFRSSDGGASWAKITLPPGEINNLATLVGQPDTLYAATLSGVFRSPDGGNSWIDISHGLTAFLHGSLLIPDPQTSRTLYAVSVGVFHLDQKPGRPPERTVPFR